LTDGELPDRFQGFHRHRVYRQPFQKLPGVGRHGFHVPPLAPSAYSVSNARLDLPEPLTPVITGQLAERHTCFDALQVVDADAFQSNEIQRCSPGQDRRALVQIFESRCQPPKLSMWFVNSTSGME